MLVDLASPIGLPLIPSGGAIVSVSHTIEPTGHHHGVAVITPLRYSTAPGRRIPSRIRPLDTGCSRHKARSDTCVLYVRDVSNLASKHEIVEPTGLHRNDIPLDLKKDLPVYRVG